MHGDIGQVVIAQLGRHLRLLVTCVPRDRLPNAGPFGVARTPESIVLDGPVELGQIERNDTRLNALAPRRVGRNTHALGASLGLAGGPPAGPEIRVRIASRAGFG